MDITITIVNILRKYINWTEVCRIPKWILGLLSPIKIAVYGESGVGKTQFIYAITGRHEYAKTRTRDITCI